MTTLITGVAGFIGSHVARRLLDRGDVVIGVDNFNDYYDPETRQRCGSGWAEELCIGRRRRPRRSVQFGQHDVTTVIHLAAMAGVRNSVREPTLYFENNLFASQRLIETARQHDVSNFVFADFVSLWSYPQDSIYGVGFM